MNTYNLVLFAHIVGTLALFMAIAVELVNLHRIRGARTTGQLREWASLTRTIDKPLPLSTVAILVSGLYMSLTVWNLTVPWIGLSLATVAIMSTVGPAVNSRRLDAIHKATETLPLGPIPPDLARRIQDPVLLVSIHTLAALGFGIVFLKVIKPDLFWAVATLAVAAILGALSTRFAPSRGGVEAEASSAQPVVADEAA